MFLLTREGPGPEKISGDSNFFQRREIFVHEDQNPVKEDVADVQVKIPKEVYCDAGTLLTKAW
jgi:hypothetical protein